MALDSMQEIFEKMQEGQKPFWKVVQDTDVEERQVTPEASFEKMRMTWKAMLETVDTYRGDLRSLSGLVGGDGQRMAEFAASGKALAGDYLSQVITLALCTAESNACMRKIVAAPTAGACGVLPAVLIPLYRQGGARGGNCAGTVRGGGHWCCYRISGLHCRRLRRMPGGDRLGLCHGGRNADSHPGAAARSRSDMPPLWL